MTEEAMKALVDALFAALNTCDATQVAALYAPDYNGDDVGQQGSERGRESVARTFGRLLAAFPDAHFTGEALIAGDRAALVWTMRGTHQGTFLRVPPTGKPIEMRGVSMITVVDGLIVQGSRIWDVAGFLRAVRLLPDLPAE